MAEQIKARLFERYTPADYFIVPGSETLLPGRLGVRYRVASPRDGEWYELTLKRTSKVRVDVVVSSHKGPHLAYTRFIASVGLPEIGERVYRYIADARRGDTPPQNRNE